MTNPYTAVPECVQCVPQRQSLITLRAPESSAADRRSEHPQELFRLDVELAFHATQSNLRPSLTREIEQHMLEHAHKIRVSLLYILFNYFKLRIYILLIR
jgi:hypothetical protein